MEKLIITVAPTGAWPTKKDTPYVPLTPKEIAEEVYECWKAGASIAYIHVRNDDASASMNFDKFKETVTFIRDKKDCDIILNLTTSGGIGLKDDERMRPFMAIITGGHVRVGMEDNIFMARGVLAKSNVEFVERVKRIAKEFQREIATPAEARAMLGLKGREPQR